MTGPWWNAQEIIIINGSMDKPGMVRRTSAFRNCPRFQGPPDAFRDASDHLLITCFPVRIQQNQHRRVVKTSVNLPDDIKVEGLSRNDACLPSSRSLLLDLRDEAAENIARSEMNPYRILLRLLPHCLNIKFRHHRAALFHAALSF